MNRLERGARESSESPPPQPSPPAYKTTKINESDFKISKHQENTTSPLNIEKSRRKRRSRSRSSSTRSSQRRSKSRDREKERSSRKHSRRDRSRSRSRSRDRRRSRSRNKSRDRHRSYRDNNRRHNRQNSWESDVGNEETSVHESLGIGRNVNQHGFMSIAQQQQQQQQQQSNAFKNDGSFMEMFKKMQEQQIPAQGTQPGINLGLNNVVGMGSMSRGPQSSSMSNILQEKTTAPPPLMVGKRRGGRILKTGMVAKPKCEINADDQPKDAWSLYMAEVKKYREVCCQEEDNTRPLVK